MTLCNVKKNIFVKIYQQTTQVIKNSSKHYKTWN